MTTTQAAQIAVRLPRSFVPSAKAPDVHSSSLAVNDNTAEIVNAYPYRSNFTTAAWWDLISRATKQIDLLGYTLYFLSLEHPQFVETVREKRENGLDVTRIARIYDGSCIYLVKPDRLRYWLGSIALRDADETLADLVDQGY